MEQNRTWSFQTEDVPPPPGQIRRETVSTTVNTTAVQDVTISKPAGTTVGDVLVACVATNGTNVAATGTPSGWTRIAAVTGASNPRTFGYYRVATASEPASYAWRLSSAVANSGGIARYSGVDASEPVAPGVQSASGAAATSATVPGVTTTEAGSMVVGCMAANTSVETMTITAPTGLAKAWDLAGKRQQLADAVQTAAGPSGNKTWTFTASRAWAGWLMALRPTG
jgi:hypothetical protein